MRHERGRGRRRLTPGSTAVTAVVAPAMCSSITGSRAGTFKRLGRQASSARV